MAMTVRLPPELERAAKEYGGRIGLHSLNALIAIALREYLKTRTGRDPLDLSSVFVGSVPAGVALGAPRPGWAQNVGARIASQVQGGPVVRVGAKKRSGKRKR